MNVAMGLLPYEYDIPKRAYSHISKRVASVSTVLQSWHESTNQQLADSGEGRLFEVKRWGLSIWSNTAECHHPSILHFLVNSRTLPLFSLSSTYRTFGINMEIHTESPDTLSQVAQQTIKSIAAEDIQATFGSDSTGESE